MAKYLVQNGRKNRIVALYGHVLASQMSATNGQAGTLWVTEDQFSSERVQRLLTLKRLVLVGTEGDQAPKAKAPSVPPPPAVEVAPEPAPEPEVEEAPEPEVIEEPEASGVAVVQPDGDIVPEEDADEEGEHWYDEDELSALTLPYIRPIAKKLSLDIFGMRKADIIQAILDAQGS